MWQIIYKEIQTWTTKPIFYILLAVFFFCIEIYFWFFQSVGHTTVATTENATLHFFHALGIGILIFCPLLVTGMFHNEIKNNTLHLLLSKPLTLRSIIWGKFLAVFILLLCFLLLSLGSFFSILHFSENTLANGLQLFLFLLFMGMAYTSITMAISCFFPSFLKSFLFSLLTLLFFHFLFNFLASWSIEGMHNTLSYMGIGGRINKLVIREENWGNILYLSSIIVLGGTITFIKLKNKVFFNTRT